MHVAGELPARSVTPSRSLQHLLQRRHANAQGYAEFGADELQNVKTALASVALLG
jgi:hypothetical protein